MPRRACFLAVALAGATGLMGAAPRPVSSGDFTAVEALTTDPAGFVEAWNRDGPHADLAVEAHLAPGKDVTPFILFKGCKPDAEGACKVTAEIRIVDPAGKPSDPASFDVWTDPPLAGGLVMRAAKAPSFGFDKADPPGRYILRARVTDAVSGAEVTLEEPVIYGDIPPA